MSAIIKLRERLQAWQITPSKRYGQNFLISEHVIDQIMNVVAGFKPTAVVELGPGVGALTDRLMEITKELVLVEKDPRLVMQWQQMALNQSRLRVIPADLLDLEQWWLNISNAVVVSNLPYEVASRFLVATCLETHRPQHMVLMFQKEVGQRILSPAVGAEYGLLSVISQLCWNIDKVVEAAPGDFYPAPKVASWVLRFQFKELDIEPSERRRFLSFLKVIFQQRRKKMLKQVGSCFLKLTPETVRATFDELGLSADVRPERVEPLQLLSLFNRLRTYEH